MLAVGIREIRAKLSQYLRHVREGELVLITDRGRVVAELRAPTVRPAMVAALNMEHLVEQGALHPGLPHDPSLYRPSEVRAAEGTAARLVGWIRGDGADAEP